MVHLVVRCLLRPSANCHRRLLSTSSKSTPNNTSSTTSWERSAKLVKNTNGASNKYLDRVRSEVVDPALQLKTIEDELCQAIGKALGRQGEKVLSAIREMGEERARYLKCVQDRCYDEAVDCAQRHNEARKRAVQARWELLVHRQAVGFTVDNHSVVHTTFPISDPLPIQDVATEGQGTDILEDSVGVAKPEQKVWSDQLSWWQRVGRWK